MTLFREKTRGIYKQIRPDMYVKIKTKHPTGTKQGDASQSIGSSMLINHTAKSGTDSSGQGS